MVEQAAIAAIAIVGAIAAGAVATRRPLLALGILFLLASLSRVTLDTPVGTMRLEQPAIAVLAIVLFVRGRFSVLRGLPRSSMVIAGCFAGYLAVLALSSAFAAPQPVESLRLVVWIGLSMLGGVVAFTLALPAPDASVEPLAFGGAVTGAIGLVLAALFYVAGPGVSFGIQEPQTILPRVTGLVWEANLYASFLAMCLPFAWEVMRRQRVAGALMLLLIAIGLPLGDTRGADLGLLAGIITYVVIRLRFERRSSALVPLGALTVAGLVVGVLAFSVLLPNPIQRYIEDGGSVGPSASAGTTVGPAQSLAPGQSVEPRPSVAPRPSLEPEPSLGAYPNTIAFRLARIPVALKDLAGSPLIGLGAESFGQRHLDPSSDDAPDHIAILAVAAVYESGVLGAGALAFGFLLLLLGLWKTAGTASRAGNLATVGITAAFIASIVSMLVSYEATNALDFAINWIVVGCAAAVLPRAIGRVAADAGSNGQTRLAESVDD